jgi:hypothetical protein
LCTSVSFIQGWHELFFSEKICENPQLRYIRHKHKHIGYIRSKLFYNGGLLNNFNSSDEKFRSRSSNASQAEPPPN